MRAMAAAHRSGAKGSGACRLQLARERQTSANRENAVDLSRSPRILLRTLGARLNLADQTIFLKASTPLELRTDGQFFRLAAEVASTLHLEWSEVNDVTGRLHATGAADVAALLSGPASRIPARARLAGEGASLEWSFGLHPYTGEEASIIELRVERIHLASTAAVEALVGLATRWCDALEPYWLAAHDSDLHGAHNCSAALAESGFGIVRDGLDEADPAGIEHNRGTMRYCANWLTYHSEALAARLDPVSPLPPEVTSRRLAHGTLYRLYTLPSDGGLAASLATQRAFRDAMGYLPTALREQPLLGYWQKRGRP